MGKYRLVKEDRRAVAVITLIMMFLVGVSSAAMDTVSHHWAGSWFATLGNDEFFNPAISWKNKYMNGDPAQGEKFLFSTTWLSWTTDFWHMAKFMLLNAITVISVLSVRLSLKRIWHWAGIAVAIRAAFQIGFTLFYDYIFLS